jgi:hypothetical protein
MHPGIEGMRNDCNPGNFTQSRPPFGKASRLEGNKGARRKTHSTWKYCELPEVFLA